MKPLFHIQADQQPHTARTLLLELGLDHGGYAFFDKASNTVAELKYFELDEWAPEANFQSLSEEIAGQEFEEVWVCAAYPFSLLTPLKYAQQSDSLLDVVYDRPAQQYLYDTINEWQMVNAYAIPAPVFESIRAQYPEARFLHAHTAALKTHSGAGAGHQVFVHFTTRYFRVLVKKEGHVHLAQTYAYKTPLDVVYYLLKIGVELSLDPAVVPLVLSGLVEEASALYGELYHYFGNLHFAQPTALSLAPNEYPRHFFTSTYNLAACVS